MLKAFQDLGDLTAVTWKQLGGHDEAFPEAATLALTQSETLNAVEVQEVIDWFASSRDVPEQYDNDFGQPPINVYVAEKFFIQVLFWLDATTAVHEHGFSGAFGVLSGSSVHSRYSFESQHALAPDFHLGNVQFLSSELLQRGGIRTILPGHAFSHSLFHLDHPSISVVVRTKKLPVTQYSYLKPHVAIDPFHRDATLSIQLKLLDSLITLRSEGIWKYAGELLDHAKPVLTFNTLSTVYGLAKDHASPWQQLLDKAVRRHGREITEMIVESIEENARINKLFKLRSVVRDPDYRFFLALLLNVPERDTLLSLVGQQFNSKNPESLVMQWITDMSDAGLFLTRFEPDLLDTIELALQYGSFADARLAIMKSDAESPLRNEERMKKLWQAAHSIPFFKSLYSPAGTSVSCLEMV